MNEYLRRDSEVEAGREKLAAESDIREKPVGPADISNAGSEDVAPVSVVGPRPTPIANSVIAGSSGTGPATARAPEEEKVALFAPNEANDLRARWDSIQVGFVDEPRKAVQEADALVSDTIKRLSEVFGNERHNLEQQWDRNEDVSTEDLRVALRRYRSFFGRLLVI
jgi:hypothetical protein